MHFFFRLAVRPSLAYDDASFALGGDFPRAIPGSGVTPADVSAIASLPLSAVVAGSPTTAALAEIRLGGSGALERVDEHSQRLVHFAAAQGDMPWVDALARQDTDWSVADRHGNTPLHLAAHAGYAVLVAALARRCPRLVRARASNGACPTLVVVLAGQEAIVAALLAASDDPNGRLTTGPCALAVAIHEAHPTIALRLLARSAYVAADDAQDAAGSTPVHAAAAPDVHWTTRLLLKAHAEALDEPGQTPMARAFSGCALIVVGLLMARVDLDRPDDEAILSVAAAARLGQWGLVHQLLALGVGPRFTAPRWRRSGALSCAATARSSCSPTTSTRGTSRRSTC